MNDIRDHRSFERAAAPRRRVLFVINSLAGGGAERVMATLLSNSEEWLNRHEIALAVLDEGPRAFPLPGWLTIFQLDCAGGLLASISGLNRVVRDFAPDVTISFLTRANLANGAVMTKRRMTHCDALNYLPDDILCKVDRASMAVSLESRVPFLDHRVAEVAARIPMSMKLHGKGGKWIVKRLLSRHVPTNLFDRPKSGFSMFLERG